APGAPGKMFVRLSHPPADGNEVISRVCPKAPPMLPPPPRRGKDPSGWFISPRRPDTIPFASSPPRRRRPVGRGSAATDRAALDPGAGISPVWGRRSAMSPLRPCPRPARRKKRKAPRAARPRGARYRRPLLEVLENRLVLTGPGG